MILDKFNKYNRFHYGQLMRLGIHVGHSVLSSSLYAAWMIYGYRGGVCLIDMSKFMLMFRLGLVTIASAVARRKPVWFVTQDRPLGRYLKYYAQKCGEFASTFYWIRGMLSNFRVVSALAESYYFMSDILKNRRRFLFDTNFEEWFYTRHTWPGLVFVNSIVQNYFVVNEALSAQVPCLGIWDTNAEPQACTIAVPGNDDSIGAIVFYGELVSEFVLYRKFVIIFLWFLNTRRQKRLLSFASWLLSRREPASKIQHLTSFFSPSIKHEPLAFFAIPYRIFLARNTMFTTVETSFERFGGSFPLDTTPLVDKFEASQFKYYYFFKYFFLANSSRARGRHLFHPQRRRRRLLYKRQRRGTHLFLLKAVRAGLIIPEELDEYDFVSKKRSRSLIGLLKLRSKIVHRKSSFYSFLHSYFLYFFCYFKGTPLARFFANKPKFSYKTFFNELVKLSEGVLWDFFEEYKDYCRARRQHYLNLYYDQEKQKKTIRSLRGSQPARRSSRGLSAGSHVFPSPRVLPKGKTVAAALFTQVSKVSGNSFRGSSASRYSHQHGVARSSKEDNFKRSLSDKRRVSHKAVPGRSDYPEEALKVRRSRSNESTFSKNPVLLQDKKDILIGKLRHSAQRSHHGGGAQRVYSRLPKTPVNASPSRRVSGASPGRRLRQRSLLRPVDLTQTDVVIREQKDIVFTAIYKRLRKQRVSFGRWCYCYLSLSEKLFADAKLPLYQSVMVQRLRSYFVQSFLRRSKRAFLRFLVFGFFRPVSFSKTTAAPLASAKHLAAFVNTQRLSQLAVLRSQLVKYLTAFKNHKYVQSTLGRLLETKVLRLSSAVRNFLQQRSQLLHGLKKSLLTLYKKFNFYKAMQVPSETFFYKSFSFYSGSSLVLFFKGLYQSFVLNFLPFHAGVSFYANAFTAYDFVIFDKGFWTHKLPQQAERRLSPRAFFFWDLNPEQSVATGSALSLGGSSHSSWLRRRRRKQKKFYGGKNL